MRIFLILSLLITGCAHNAPKFPKDIFYVMDEKVNTCLMYETPDDPEGKYIYKGKTHLSQCYQFSDSQSLYCIKPSYHMRLRKYGKEMKRYVENLIDDLNQKVQSCQAQQR